MFLWVFLFKNLISQPHILLQILVEFMNSIRVALFKFDPSDLEGLNVGFVVQLIIILRFITNNKR
jgi:hypothetical protein